MNMIAERLKAFRNQQGHNQEGVAKVAGMSQRAWSGWEEDPPKALRSLVDLARHYGVSADYLLALTDDPTPRRAKFNDTLQRLLQVVRTLPPQRIDDLLVIAMALAAHDQDVKSSTSADNTAARIEASMNVFTRRHGQQAADDLIDLLSELVPELGALMSPDAPDEHKRIGNSK